MKDVIPDQSQTELDLLAQAKQTLNALGLEQIRLAEHQRILQIGLSDPDFENSDSDTRNDCGKDQGPRLPICYFRSHLRFTGAERFRVTIRLIGSFNHHTSLQIIEGFSITAAF